MSYNTCFQKHGKNSKHVYNIENLNIKTNLDGMAFTDLLSIIAQVPLQMSPLKIIQQHLEAQHRLFEGKSSSLIHLRSHISWNTHFQLLFSTNTISSFNGLSKHRVGLSDLSDAPSNILILQILPLLSLYTFTIRAIGN